MIGSKHDETCLCAADNRVGCGMIIRVSAGVIVPGRLAEHRAMMWISDHELWPLSQYWNKSVTLANAASESSRKAAEQTP